MVLNQKFKKYYHAQLCCDNCKPNKTTKSTCVDFYLDLVTLYPDGKVATQYQAKKKESVFIYFYIGFFSNETLFLWVFSRVTRSIFTRIYTFLIPGSASETYLTERAHIASDINFKKK